MLIIAIRVTITALICEEVAALLFDPSAMAGVGDCVLVGEGVVGDLVGLRVMPRSRRQVPGTSPTSTSAGTPEVPSAMGLDTTGDMVVMLHSVLSPLAHPHLGPAFCLGQKSMHISSFEPAPKMISTSDLLVCLFVFRSQSKNVSCLPKTATLKGKTLNVHHRHSE